MRALILSLFLLPALAWGAPYPHGTQLATWAAGITGIIPQATPTDICAITGKAGKTIRVHKIRLSSTQSTAGNNTWYITKRSSGNVGVSFTALTSVPMDSNTGSSGSAGASLVAYYGNPTTLGALLGFISTPVILSPAPAGLYSAFTDLDFVHGNDDPVQPPTLRSASEMLTINFGGAALPTGLTVNCDFLWTEE